MADYIHALTLLLMALSTLLQAIFITCFAYYSMMIYQLHPDLFTVLVITFTILIAQREPLVV